MKIRKMPNRLVIEYNLWVSRLSLFSRNFTISRRAFGRMFNAILMAVPVSYPHPRRPQTDVKESRKKEFEEYTSKYMKRRHTTLVFSSIMMPCTDVIVQVFYYSFDCCHFIYQIAFCGISCRIIIDFCRTPEILSRHLRLFSARIIM